MRIMSWLGKGMGDMLLPTRVVLLDDDADHGVRLSPADRATTLVVALHFRHIPICGDGILARIPTTQGEAVK